ncbi:MAG: nitrile hydratase subunit alpha [Pseudomonadota bacterium]
MKPQKIPTMLMNEKTVWSRVDTNTTSERFDERRNASEWLASSRKSLNHNIEGSKAMMNPSNVDQAKGAQKMDFYERVWSDDAYRARLEQDPKSALAEIGWNIPEGIDVRIAFDTDDVKHFHIPQAPAEGEVSDGELLSAHGGTTPLCVTAAVVVSAGGSAAGSYFLSKAV